MCLRDLVVTLPWTGGGPDFYYAFWAGYGLTSSESWDDWFIDDFPAFLEQFVDTSGTDIDYWCRNLAPGLYRGTFTNGEPTVTPESGWAYYDPFCDDYGPDGSGLEPHCVWNPDHSAAAADGYSIGMYFPEDECAVQVPTDAQLAGTY